MSSRASGSGTDRTRRPQAEGTPVLEEGPGRPPQSPSHGCSTPCGPPPPGFPQITPRAFPEPRRSVLCTGLAAVTGDHFRLCITKSQRVNKTRPCQGQQPARLSPARALCGRGPSSCPDRPLGAAVAWGEDASPLRSERWLVSNTKNR